MSSAAREKSEKDEKKSHTWSRIMGFMRRMRPRSKKVIDPGRDPVPIPAYFGPDMTKLLPEKVLRLIFEQVCPHATDNTYESSEFSVSPDGCMLCDLRDLACCIQVCKEWKPVAIDVLYGSIRIEAVHYCPLEEIFEEIRRRKAKNKEPIDPPVERLRLLCRTVRENQTCAEAVRILKLPYMTCQGQKALLAQTVSVLPNLEYADLPDGVFSGDPYCHTLRQELQARCPNLRKMKYNEGGEQSLELILNGHWQRLCVMEISKLQVEPAILRQAIGMLPELKHLTLADLPWVDDSIFARVKGVPDFPDLDTLTLKKMSYLTEEGLLYYLGGDPELKTLQLTDCRRIPADKLHAILKAGTQIRHFTYAATVSTTLLHQALPKLASASLRILKYEVVSSHSTEHSMYPPAASYYRYLHESIVDNALPELRELYVRDGDFAESLTLVPPVLPFAEPVSKRPQGVHFDTAFLRPRGMTRELDVYSKRLDEHEWVYTKVVPADHFGRRGSISGGRPLSSYSANKGLGPHWGGDSRHSVVVGNGFGGYLAVPASPPERPRSAGHQGVAAANSTRASWINDIRHSYAVQNDLWR
jgi:hypothetical protein